METKVKKTSFLVTSFMRYYAITIFIVIKPNNNNPFSLCVVDDFVANPGTAIHHCQHDNANHSHCDTEAQHDIPNQLFVLCR